MIPYMLYWTRRDRQQDICIGKYPSVEEAKAAILDSLTKLESQCAEPDVRAELYAGFFTVSLGNEVLHSEWANRCRA